MIRTDALINDEALEGFSDLLAFVPDIAQEAGERVFARYRDDYLRELSAYPDRVKYPIEWQSERQRRAFFATDGFGKGIPYRRTYTLQRAWQLRFDVISDGFTLSVINQTPYTPFVVGLLRPAANEWQQRFHRNTGWDKASATIDFWTNALADEFVKQFSVEFFNR